jgi:hypothetical protein
MGSAFAFKRLNRVPHFPLDVLECVVESKHWKSMSKDEAPRKSTSIDVSLLQNTTHFLEHGKAFAEDPRWSLVAVS